MDLDEEREILEWLVSELDGEAAEVVAARLRYLDAHKTTLVRASELELAVDRYQDADSEAERLEAIQDIAATTDSLLDRVAAQR